MVTLELKLKLNHVFFVYFTVNVTYDGLIVRENK